jgi:hypothetical protein
MEAGDETAAHREPADGTGSGGATVDSQAIDEVRALLQDGRDKHSPRLDAIRYNYGTLIALAATSAATIVPWAIWAKAAAAVATFIIALSRAMDFGGRWRWHWEMRMGYQALLDRTTELSALPDAEKLDMLKTIYDGLADLRKREGNIPGTSGASIGA